VLCIGCNSTAVLADDVITSRVTASLLSLGDTKTALTTEQGRLWGTQLNDIAAKRSLLVKSDPDLPMAIEAFSATIQSKDGQFVVSALNAPGNCTSSSAVPHQLDCLAKLTQVSGNVSVVKGETSIPDFPIAMVRGPAGYDASSNENTSERTEVIYNEDAKTFSYQVFHDNEPSPPVQFYPTGK
jgi:hypothetical protein